jgi:repressor LexA
MLTRQQYRLLAFIQSYVREHGYSPSYEEMRNELELKSRSGVHRLVHSLKDRGFVRVLPNLARAVEIVRLPEGPLSADPHLSVADGMSSARF